jgi:hypothetical protein
MRRVGLISPIPALCVLISLLPGFASAEERNPLLLPTLAATAAAAADWGSTYYALRFFELREVNPLLSPLQTRPGRMISLGAAMDAGLVSAWNLSIGRRNDGVAAAGLWAMTAFRAYLAIHNLRNTRRAARRAPVEMPFTLPPPAIPGASMTCEAPATGRACVAVVQTPR